MRTCCSCSTPKPEDDFSPPGRSRKTNYECRVCHNSRKKARYRERATSGRVDPEGTCRDCGITKSADDFGRNWHRRSGLAYRCNDCQGHANRERHFKISPAEYAAMLHAQQGVCAICGQAEDDLSKGGKVKALAVDHNHDTGKIRGLLCGNCNRGLGNFGDNLDTLIAAVTYMMETTTMRTADAPFVGGDCLPNEEVI